MPSRSGSWRDLRGEPGGTPSRPRRPSACGQAGLDQQQAARRQPVGRPGDHPALDVEAVGAAVERDPVPRGRGPREASSRSPSVGTYGALATTSVDPAAQVRRAARRTGRPRAPGPAAGCGARTSTAAGSTSTAYTSRSGTAASSAARDGAGAAAEVDDDVARPQDGLEREPHEQLGPAARHEDRRRDRDPQPAELRPARRPARAARPRPASATMRSRCRVVRGGLDQQRAPPPRRTRSPRRAAARRARRAGRRGHRDDGSMPGALDQITYVVVGYAVLVAAPGGVLAPSAGASARRGWTRWRGCWSSCS